MTDGNEVPLLKYLEQRLDAMDKALHIQAVEYERRLEQLNGERGREREQQRLYVRTDKFDSFVSEQERAIQSIREYVSESKGSQRTLLIVLGGSITFVTVAVEIALHFIR